MMKLLLFAGTTEGRTLAERLRALPVQATICVATEYGGEMLGGLADRFAVRVGRMDAAAMRALMAETGCRYVIDATHPYAVTVSSNIRRAAAEAVVPYLRLLRGESPAGACVYVESAAAAAQALVETGGNVLLTTGVKELSVYTAVPEYADRLYPRVLPSVESVRACAELGFRRDHVIAMQGPFSRELNRALMRQFAIAVMVTKDGGAPGGFPEKMLAAEDAGVRVVVIGRPPEADGQTQDDILSIIREGVKA